MDGVLMDTANNVGRFATVKAAFIRHIQAGMAAFYPATPQLAAFNQRPAHLRLMVAEDRMVDKAQELLEAYQKAGNNGTHGIHAPLPVILMAFAKDTNPIAAERGRAVAQEKMIRLDDRYYSMRLAHLENRVQLCFFAYEDETARAMTTQLRLWLQQFRRRFFPVQWHFEGHDFELTASIEDTDITDEIADIDERVNLTVLFWNITLNFQMPYLAGSGELNEQGFDNGWGTIRQVDIDIQDETRDNVGLHLQGVATADSDTWSSE